MGSRIPSHQLSNGLYVSGRPKQLLKERKPTIASRAIPYTGGDVNKSGELGKMFNIPTDHCPSCSSSQQKISGPFRSIPKRTTSSSSSSSSGSGPIQPTGLLLTSGPLGSSSTYVVGRIASDQLEAPPAKGKTVYGPAVTTLGYDEVRVGLKVSKRLMWMLVVMAVMGIMVGTFLMVAVKKGLILLPVGGVLVVTGVVVCWNCACHKNTFMPFTKIP